MKNRLVKISLTIISILSLALPQTALAQDSSPYLWQEGQDRIIAGTIVLAEICEALELPLVGVTSHKADELPEPYQDLQQVGSGPRVNYELMATLDADYYLTTDIFEGITRDQAEAIGVEPIFYKLSTYEDTFETIEAVGEKFNRKELAQDLVTKLKEEEAKVLEGSDPLENSSIFILYGYADGLAACSSDLYIGSLVEKLGMKNVADEFIPDGLGYSQYSTEAVIAQDPDYIIVYTMTSEFNRTDQESENSIEDLAKSELDQAIWQETSAFKNKRVIYLDSNDIPIQAGLDTVSNLEKVKKILLEVQ